MLLFLLLLYLRTQTTVQMDGTSVNLVERENVFTLEMYRNKSPRKMLVSYAQLEEVGFLTWMKQEVQQRTISLSLCWQIMLELVIGESLDISGDFNGGLEQHAMDVTVNITGEIGLGTMTMNKCNGLTG